MSTLHILSELMPDEHVLREGQGYILTTIRLRSANNRHIKSLMLSDVTSCRIEYVDHPIWIVAGVILTLAGLFISSWFNTSGPVVLMAAIALVAFVAYFQTRSGQVVIASPTLKIVIRFEGTSNSEMLALIDLLEQAKHLPD